MIKEKIDKAKPLFSSDSYVQELIFEELEAHEKGKDNFGNAEFLESLNDLLFCLYALDEKPICLEFYEYFENIKPIEDKRIWTWLESSLLLFSVLFSEKGDNEKSQKCLRLVKDAFKLGNDLVVSVNENARKRKMSGNLLPYKSINQSLKDEDTDDELTYRLILLRGLMYIQALGFSESMPSSKVENEINGSIQALRKLL